MKSVILNLLITASLLFCNLSIGQNKYSEYINEAEKSYQSKGYKKSATKYKEAFNEIEGKAHPNDRYNAAASYALAGDIENSFYHLFRLAEGLKTKYKNYKKITTNTDFKNLHDDNRWIKLIEIIKTNKEEAEKYLDKSLVESLSTIYDDDQTYRLQDGEVEKKYGRNSEELKAHRILIHTKDSINLIKVKKILDERGWLGKEIVGEKGNLTLFLVIQHSDLEAQLKYLPMIREAVIKGDVNASYFALLEDRVALRQGEKQIYGSQLTRDKETGEYFVSPLIDPENVDKRRHEVGLGPISDYLTYWGMVWDIKKHKQRIKNKDK